MTDTPKPSELPWTTAPEWIDKRIGRLEVTHDAKQRAKELSHKYGIEKSIGTPKAVAAAAVYLAGLETNEKRVQEAVAGAFGVSQQTIRENYHEMCEGEGYELRGTNTAEETERHGLGKRIKEALLR